MEKSHSCQKTLLKNIYWDGQYIIKGKNQNTKVYVQNNLNCINI